MGTPSAGLLDLLRGQQRLPVAEEALDLDEELTGLLEGASLGRQPRRILAKTQHQEQQEAP
eukprot:12402941-Alexandrium_andersonii.AAC.1